MTAGLMRHWRSGGDRAKLRLSITVDILLRIICLRSSDRHWRSVVYGRLRLRIPRKLCNSKF
jgi:hypothetical protein